MSHQNTDPWRTTTDTKSGMTGIAPARGTPPPLQTSGRGAEAPLPPDTAPGGASPRLRYRYGSVEFGITSRSPSDRIQYDTKFGSSCIALAPCTPLQLQAPVRGASSELRSCGGSALSRRLRFRGVHGT